MTKKKRKKTARKMTIPIPVTMMTKKKRKKMTMKKKPMLINLAMTRKKKKLLLLADPPQRLDHLVVALKAKAIMIRSSPLPNLARAPLHVGARSAEVMMMMTMTEKTTRCRRNLLQKIKGHQKGRRTVDRRLIRIQIQTVFLQPHHCRQMKVGLLWFYFCFHPLPPSANETVPLPLLCHFHFH